MPTAVTQAFITAGTALSNGTAYVLAENVTMSSPFSFSGSGEGVTFDGSGHTITVPDQWLGLFCQAVTVSNLGVLSSGSTRNSAGWFFQSGVGGNATNCYSTGTIAGEVASLVIVHQELPQTVTARVILLTMEVVSLA